MDGRHCTGGARGGSRLGSSRPAWAFGLQAIVNMVANPIENAVDSSLFVNLVVNNLIAANRGGALKVTGRGRVLHNTFSANEGAILALDPVEGSAQGSTLFANNLLDHDGPLFENDRPDGRHHNVYANDTTARPLGDGSRVGPVAFRDVARRDYRPAVDSVAIDELRRDATVMRPRKKAAK